VRREPDRVSGPPARPRKVRRKVSTAPRRAAARAQIAPARRSRIALTHPERVLFPKDGITKLQLAEYYEGIAPVLWPHLKGRPLSLIRSTSSPGRVFFQRHIDGDATAGLKSVRIADPGGKGDREPYFVCSSEASIPLLAQMGAVELHTWGSRLPRPEHADRLTFDLDPDPALPWRTVREAATLLRGMLEELGLESLLKTSGGNGLHVVVPLSAGPTLEIAAAFARRVASHLARVVPDRFAAKRGAANRKGKVYVDWQRNQFAATTVAAYSPRHRAGVPVSLPIAWEELGKQDLRGAHFNLRNVIARVAAEGDAWSASLPLRQTLTRRVIDRLEAAAGEGADHRGSRSGKDHA
jgi:bifunctional non-homologous end joining protein LigD